jgi:hypothetical protein
MTGNDNGMSRALSTPHAVIAEILIQERTRPRPGKPDGLSKSNIPNDVVSISTYNKLEAGTYPKIKPAMISEIMNFFQSDDALIQQVRELAKATHEENWWDAYRPGITDNNWLRVQRQERASHIISHFNNFMPVLAQSVEYLEALFESFKTTVEPHNGDLDAAFRLRLERLERWEDSEQPLTCVIGEAALKIDLGPGVMDAQLRHLLKLHELPHAEIFVIPFSAGRYGVLDYEFDVLEFSDGQESIVWVSGLNDRYLTSDSRHGRFFRDGINEAADKAITIKEYASGNE